MRTSTFCAVVAGLFFCSPYVSNNVASALPYFKCTSGYTFDMNNAGTGSHCKKQIAPKVKPISCPHVKILGTSVGTFQVSKYGKDKCKGTLKVGGVTNSTEISPVACPSGYSYKKNYAGNKDRCVKPGGWIFKAPTVQFNSN